MKEIKLNLTIDETNLIMDALGNMPFKEVFQLIQKIQQQAGSQLQTKIPEMDLNEKDAKKPSPVKA